MAGGPGFEPRLTESEFASPCPWLSADSAPHLSPTTTIALPWTAPSFAAVKGIIHAPGAKPTMKPESLYAAEQ